MQAAALNFYSAMSYMIQDNVASWAPGSEEADSEKQVEVQEGYWAEGRQLRWRGRKWPRVEREQSGCSAFSADVSANPHGEL